MPRKRSRATDYTSDDSHKTIDPEDHVDLEIDNDNEDVVEEEVDYEEVEEVEVEEEEDEEVEEEVEEEDEKNIFNGDRENVVEDESMKDTDAEAELERKHAELLALPPHGSEVYVGVFPQDISEEELRQFCESAGEVTEVRIIKGKGSTENKGYAFVTYRTKEMASEAIKSLNGTQLKGKKLKCSKSQEKHKHQLFIGNIPRTWGEEEVKNVVNKTGPGVINVQLVKDPQNSSRNRGFAFIEYYNHACAEYSREKMSNPKFKLDENDPTVSWADPPKNVDPPSSSQVKTVYVKNLPKNITEDKLRDLFKHHGKITKVILPPAKSGHGNNRFGFILFAEKSSAMKAIKNTEKYEIDGQVLECALAKANVDQRSSSSGGATTHKSTMLRTYPSAGAGLAQPMMYGRGGGAHGGLAMIPMLFPDGRVGYVLQQPGIHAAPLTSPSYRVGGGHSGGGGGSGGGSSERRRSSSDRGYSGGGGGGSGGGSSERRSSRNDRGHGGRYSSNSRRYNPY